MPCTLRRCACRLQAFVREKKVLADQVAKLADQVAERDEKLAKLMSESEEMYQQLDMIPSRKGSSEGMMRKGVTIEVGGRALSCQK